MGLLGRNGGELHRLFVEETEIQVHKIDPPDAILFLFQADSLTGQGTADKELIGPAKVDGARVVNGADQVVMGIDGFGQPVGIPFQRWLIDVARTLHFQRLMGSTLIEVLTKSIQLFLLRQ